MSITNPNTEIFNEIEAGIWDDGIDAIIEACVARRKFVRDMKGAENQMQFQHGDHVRIANISPRYMIGVTGRINKQRTPNRRGDIMVDIDDHRYYGRVSSRFSQTISIPASSLERA